MNEDFLNEELKRIGQEKLLDKCEVANSIYELYKNENMKSVCKIREFRGLYCKFVCFITMNMIYYTIE